MTTRISENQIARSLMNSIMRNRNAVDKLGQQISTGIKVAEPGDSTYSGTVSQLRSIIDRVNGYENRIKTIDSSLSFQEEVLGQASELLVRAKEVAAQGANETNSPTERSAMAKEVFQLRDHLVSLANSQYQGIYIFHGAATDQPTFLEDTYATGTGEAAERWVYDDRSPEANGHDLTRDVRVTDNLTVRVNTQGDQMFEDAVLALERLGRALDGFRTDTPPAAIGTAGTGAAYAANEFSIQTMDIQAQMDALDLARETKIQPERVDIAGRLKRLETASSLIELSKISTKDALSKLQDADIVESASNLSIAQTALEASLTVSSRILNLSILDYL